jgi:P4 family phage/plasmid primase-like protien
LEECNPNTDGANTSLTELAGYEPASVLETAKHYINLGLHITPLDGKKPQLGGWTTRELSEDQLEAHLKDDRNIGIVLGGVYGLVDVDLDHPYAVEVAKYLLPDTLACGRENRPHSHRLYLCDPLPANRTYTLTPAMASDLGLASERATLVEIRGEGQQMVVAPSVHPVDGDRYSWREGEIQRLDGAELERFTREVAIAILLALYWKKGIRQKLALYAAGYLGRHMDRGRVEAIIEAVVAAAKDEEPGKRREAVQDTFKRLAADEEARGGPNLDEFAPGVPTQIARWCGWDSDGPAASESTSGDDVPTHDELLDRWIVGRERPLAYGQEEWRQYDTAAGVWTKIHLHLVESEIDQVLVDAKGEGVRPTAGTRSSVERMARAKLFVADEKWDANTDILVCRNGTLEIPIMTLREHSPEDYALGAVPFAYDPKVEAPTWRRFLESTIPGSAGFLQEFAGYCLTADTTLEIAVWLYGPPGTGKSTFIEGLKTMLGLRAGLLGLADIHRSRFALSKIPGKTLLTATEQPSEFLKSTDVLNAIISGEEVQVEEKFKPSYTTIPRAKLLWAMNELPRVGDANSGLFRRVKVVKFPRLQGTPDPSVKERIKEEGAGILNWALEGLLRLRERGHFEIPEPVRMATEDFTSTNDVPAAFIADVCITGDAVKLEEQAQSLYNAYRHWCRENGHKPVSATKVAREWERLGFEKKMRGGRTFYCGLKVDEGWIESQENYPRI